VTAKKTDLFIETWSRGDSQRPCIIAEIDGTEQPYQSFEMKIAPLQNNDAVFGFISFYSASRRVRSGLLCGFRAGFSKLFC